MREEVLEAALLVFGAGEEGGQPEDEVGGIVASEGGVEERGLRGVAVASPAGGGAAEAGGFGLVAFDAADSADVLAIAD